MPQRTARTRRLVQIFRGLGLQRKTPGRVPQQISPELIKREYTAALRELWSRDRVRLAFADLLAELPGLLASAARDRRIDADEEALRFDAGEGRRARELVARARENLAKQVEPVAVEKLARKFAINTSTHSRLQLLRQTKSALGIDVFLADPRLPALLEAFVDANVGLITNIGDQLAANIEAAVINGVQNGQLHGDLAADLEARFGLGEKRSKLIARDQVGKYYGQVNAARQRELGIRRFIWRTVNDDRVREEHEDRDGETYSYDDPPDGELPGEAINCRCWADPVFEDLLSELDDLDEDDAA